jgi:uncharacterized OB-fold protein|tara:strand:- start:137 stop:583 length:447 start_codon:yes stop_codon:yes gene_type:complete
MIETVPAPRIDNPLDRPFWQATAAGKLKIQRCSVCESFWFPARVACAHCPSGELVWEVVSGKGRIWSYTIAHPPLLPAFAKYAPYVVAVIELAEHASLRMVGNILPETGWAINAIRGDQLAINQDVEVDFMKLEDNVVIPCWRLITLV